MVLETRGLSKRFRKRMAVAGLDLAVSRGDVYGFLGPNGAGKTTTMRMIVGLIRPSAGSVRLLGEELHFWRRRPLARVGAIVETPSFYSYLSGRDNLRLLADLSGGCPASRIEQVLERVGMRERAVDPVRIYSHGMKQRLAIAAALLPGPELILLDEPTNGLDPMGIRDVRALIRSLARDDGLTVFLSSHLLSEVEQVCNRAGVVHLGKKIWEGRVAELLAARRRLEVEATPAEAARAVLEELAGQVTAAGAGFVVAGEIDPAEAVARLVAAGCRVAKVLSSVPTLEEVFVEMLGERGGDR